MNYEKVHLMNKIRDFWNLVGPIFTILLIITAIWYASAVWLNSAWAYDKAKRANVSISFSEMVSDTMIQEKPLLPSPHQVIKEIYKTTVLKKVTTPELHGLLYQFTLQVQPTLTQDSHRLPVTTTG